MNDMANLFQLLLIVYALLIYVLLTNVMQVPGHEILVLLRAPVIFQTCQIHPDAVLLLSSSSSFIWKLLYR